MHLDAESRRRGGRRGEDERKSKPENTETAEILALGPVAGLGLDHEAFGFCGELQAAKAGDAHGDVGDEAEVVLAAEFLLNVAVNLSDAHGLRYLKAAPTRFPRDPHEDAFAVRAAATQQAAERSTL